MYVYDYEKNKIQEKLS